LQPPAGTLRAVSERPSRATGDAPADAVVADGSENLLIEGENLDALKLLRVRLGGRVKIIYLDPPYNTGRELVYEDDFRGPRAPAGTRRSGCGDAADGSRLHAPWLDMMYPRLWLARDLLRRDGVLFVSIDDGELPNLLALCREIFGEENHVATFVWEKKRKASNLDRQVRSVAEYVVCFRREQPVALVAPEDVVERDKPYPFYNTGNRRTVLRFPGGRVRTTLPDGGYAAGRYDDRRTHVVLLDDVTVRDGVVVNDFRLEGEWRYAQASVDRLLAAQQRIELRGRRFKPYFINDGERAKLVRTLLTRGTYDVGTNEDGNAEIAGLFGADVFSFPKPTSLIVKLCQIVGDREALVLDFFAGSGTTGHAVMALNAADGGRRRFVLVQSPEPLDPASKAQAAAVAFCDVHGLPRTIAQLTGERLRRAAAAIGRAHPDDAGNLDFRTLAIAAREAAP
ncbi:site-specific DNA-methyltransferase, partial [Candidatus Binatia bacterium]|nr:site-specific DNA-methyltransferase [Candidatus Binatia bacterium]